MPFSENDVPVLVMGRGCVSTNFTCTVPPAGISSFNERTSTAFAGVIPPPPPVPAPPPLPPGPLAIRALAAEINSVIERRYNFWSPQ
jgi:hypothetical protein